MIIKKPYAFLIKNFRIIHFILSLLVVYLLTKTSSIVKFFNDYVKNGYYAYAENLQSKYINFYMFLAAILIILLTLFIYLLMRWKKKSTGFYMTFIGYYFLLFIIFIIYFNALGNVTEGVLTVRAVRAYRDIILIFYVPQFIFLIISIVRAIGFDIKKFDFKKDLEDLDIAEEDQEEIEVTLGSQGYKIKRWFRKSIREFSYYIRENKFFFGVICAVGVLVLTLVIYLNRNVYSKTYTETENLDIDGLIFNVKDSYITDLDYNGNIVDKNKRFVVVKVEIENTNTVRTELDTENLLLVLDTEKYYPRFTVNASFVDIGEGITENKTIYTGEKNEYLVIFDVPKDIVFNRATLRLNQSVDVIKGEIKTRYKEVILKVDELFMEDTNEKYKTNEIVDLKDTMLKNSNVKVKNYTLNDSFTETFEYTVGNKKYTGSKIIKPDSIGKGTRTIMKLDLDYTLDESLYINKYIDSKSDFFNYFGKITYNYDGTIKTVKPVIKEYNGMNFNSIYMEVPDEIKKASSIKVEICIRNKKYLINL